MPLLIAIMGPTASGKTPLAEAISEELKAELINADAFQIYRGLNIGTAKPRDRDRYHLLDIKDPNEAFGLGAWLDLVHPILTELYRRDRHAVVVGGTGLYIRALLEEYAEIAPPPDPDLRRELSETPIEILRLRLAKEWPEVAAKTDLANPRRVRRALERILGPTLGTPASLPPFNKIKVGLDPGPEMIKQRITTRLEEMVHNGWAREVERLREAGFRLHDPGLRAIGYRAMWDHLDGKSTLDEAMARTEIETRQYAKRQRTWLRAEPSLQLLSSDSPAVELRELARRAMI